MNLDRKRIGYCRDIARKILKESGSLKVPIDVNKIADFYGFRVALLDQPSEKFSGITHKTKKAIGINKNHHPVRQRFSLAHELGHYFLDHPTADEELPSEEGDQERNIYESEANEFAGELLVPREVLKSSLMEHKDIESLKKLFNVSRHVITLQITKHGFLKEI